MGCLNSKEDKNKKKGGGGGGDQEAIVPSGGGDTGGGEDDGCGASNSVTSSSGGDGSGQSNQSNSHSNNDTNNNNNNNNSHSASTPSVIPQLPVPGKGGCGGGGGGDGGGECAVPRTEAVPIAASPAHRDRFGSGRSSSAEGSGASSTLHPGSASVRGAPMASSPRLGPVVETSELSKRHTGEGLKMVNQYIMLQHLGEGSFGKVKLCENSLTHEKVAIKIMKKSLLKRAKTGFLTNALQDVLREIAILKKLSHPNVVTLFEVIDSPETDKMYLVFEHCDGGGLAGSTSEIEPIPEDLAWQYMRDVACGIQYLHKQRIIHRDIKPENLLLDAGGRVKLSDFGVSHIYNEGSRGSVTRTVGTDAFLAPEVVRPNQEKGTKALGAPIDVWAIGVTLYMLIFGKLPFYDDNRLDLYAHIWRDPVVFPEAPVASEPLRAFLLRLLDKDPETRITVDEMFDDPWITRGGEEPLVNASFGEVSVTQREIDSAIGGADRFALLVKIKSKLRKRHREAKERIAQRRARAGSDPTAAATTASGESEQQQQLLAPTAGGGAATALPTSSSSSSSSSSATPATPAGGGSNTSDGAKNNINASISNGGGHGGHHRQAASADPAPGRKTIVGDGGESDTGLLGGSSADSPLGSGRAKRGAGTGTVSLLGGGPSVAGGGYVNYTSDIEEDDDESS